MSNTLKITLIVSGIIIAAALLLAAGFLLGRLGWWASGIGPGWMMGWQSNTPAGQSGWIGPGMMGGYSQRGGTPRLGESWGHMGAGMMGGYWGGGQSQAEPLSLDQAQEAVANFLADYGNEGFVNEDLVIEEIMIFDNHAYAVISEESTGIGAMEVLVDPLTLQVYPEHGPNMMWNLKYGMMSANGAPGMMGSGMMGSGMMGGSWRGYPSQGVEVSAEMSVSPEQAVEAAQAYLDRNLPGVQVEEHADRFYGYYTLHTLQDGKVSGMLSVNGFSRQVFLHTWHGDFIEMSASSR